ncbi:hypothetical protein BHYA_0326g00050 [Botrytis hyacinthi]|uniref:Uncharacterized protein n=1 Tax=Botrytis hyacinthi TaxID=278943 RepID=A0A4Z1GAD1_9HELO|nr:hypothetical protein BHYA_0326g00050 [Botrytis hyacinthi]
MKWSERHYAGNNKKHPRLDCDRSIVDIPTSRLLNPGADKVMRGDGTGADPIVSRQEFSGNVRVRG